MKHNEEAILEMPFETLLTKITHMPTTFLVCENETPAEGLAALDKEMQIKVPTILLERLKKEFDDSNNQLQPTKKKF